MFVAQDSEGVSFWAGIMSVSLRGMLRKGSTINPAPYIEEAEVLYGQTAVDVGDSVLFYK